MATVRTITISLLHLAGITDINRTVQHIAREQTRAGWPGPAVSAT
jgi:hypothetical protein